MYSNQVGVGIVCLKQIHMEMHSIRALDDIIQLRGAYAPVEQNPKLAVLVFEK